MFIQANPSRQKPAEEKEEIAKRYKRGNTVLPEIDGDSGDSESNEEDRRLLEEVREMSLRDVDTRRSRQSSAGGTQSSGDRRERDRASQRGERERQPRRRGEEERRRRAETRQDTSSTATRNSGPNAGATSGRQIEHQSSLRSLLSASDGESVLEEQILRQIVEEGLLDDIDLRNLNQVQEDELTERIAEAYRRRHQQRSPAQQRTRSDASERPRTPQRRVRSQSAQARAAEPARQRPPVSNPHLLETPVPSPVNRHQRSSSDQGNRRRRPSTSPINRGQLSDVALPSATRSNSDIVSGPRSSRSARSTPRESRTNSIPRSIGEPDSMVRRERGSRASDRRPIDSPTLSPAATMPIQQPLSLNRPGSSSAQAGPPRSGLREPSSTRDRSASSRASSIRPDANRPDPPLFPEPSLSCDRCGAQELQYELHKSCSKCTSGKYNLCLHCYRLGRGCLHWFGFGSSAQVRFEKAFPQSATGSNTPTRELPHELTSHKYRRPAPDSVEQVIDGSRKMTSDNPANRLQAGMFCDMCKSFADGWFWKCNRCNEGEWGFCNRCVNQGKCCTHPLLPITRIESDDTLPQPIGSSALNARNTISNSPSAYRPLAFSTKCDICTYPIPPSTTRFHCPECNDGNYNICTNCYHKAVSAGKIAKENGPNGWRRCLKGHRMIVVGFVDHEDGQRRVIVKELVGGHALKDDNVVASPSPPAITTSSPDAGSGDWSWRDGPDGNRKKTSRARAPWASTTSLASSPTAISFDAAAPTHVDSPNTTAATISQFPSPPIPPSGGIGLRLLALWSYYPDPNDSDELSFPRGAEISEAENINDDWFWGCYAGNKGLFPGAYGRVLGEI